MAEVQGVSGPAKPNAFSSGSFPRGKGGRREEGKKGRGERGKGGDPPQGG